MKHAKLAIAALLISATAVADDTATAVFAGGCFWCMEPPFDALDGVLETTSGYTGGRTENPTYEEVGTHRTGHLEAVQVTYDPSKITYQQLLAVFWPNVDPFDDSGQRHMEYLAYRGEFAEPPIEEISRTFTEHYAHWNAGKRGFDGDFEREVTAETARG